MIHESWESELYKYLGGIVRNHRGKAIEINGMPDHVHLLVRLQPVEAIADFLRELKASSSKRAKGKAPSFGWQRRYAAFSVSESVSDAVRRYIQNQKEHHKKQTFEEEYVELLRLHNVPFDLKYLWE